MIAAVNGLAIGGGFELALACDLIVAAENAEFALPEAGLGLVADAGGVQRLARRIAPNLAMELLLTGRRIDAAEAQRLGLVNQVVPLGSLMSAARALATTIAAKAPLSTRAIKALTRAGEGLSVEAMFKAMRAGRIPAYSAAARLRRRARGPARLRREPPAGLDRAVKMAPTTATAPQTRYVAGALSVLAGGLCWSFTGVFVRLAPHLDRLAVPRLSRARRRRRLRADRARRGAHSPAFARSASLGMVATAALSFAAIGFIVALKMTSVANALFLSSCAPLLSALLGFAILGERLEAAADRRGGARILRPGDHPERRLRRGHLPATPGAFCAR